MQITVNKVDGIVGKDGLYHPVDCSPLPAYVRVIQWDTVKKTGHIEFHPDADGKFVPNMNIIDFTPYQYLADGWDDAQRKADAKAKAKAPGA